MDDFNQINRFGAVRHRGNGRGNQHHHQEEGRKQYFLRAGQLRGQASDAVPPGGQAVAVAGPQRNRRLIDVSILLDRSMNLNQAHAICDEIEAEIAAVFAPCDTVIHLEPFHIELIFGEGMVDIDIRAAQS